MATVAWKVFCTATLKSWTYGGATLAKKKLSDKEKIEQLQKQLKESQQQLKYEKLKSKALDKMIDIAEEDLNISIRKKRGAEQSKK